jgi:hypothetical protein
VDQDAQVPRAPASGRLELEVSLLTGATAPADNPTRARGERRHTILVAMADPDLRAYVAQCLRDREDVRVEEIGPEGAPLEVAERLQADLLIADLSVIAGGGAALGQTPLLLTGDELPDELPVGAGVRIAFLLQPFNARRLLEVVERLLGARRPVPSR